MTEYRKGLPGELEDLRDFANYVFSQAHRPHDFSKLISKVYGDGHQVEDFHYVALEEGKIRGMIAAYPHEYNVAGTTLNTRFIGTVSTHPYHRGNGYMKQLMKNIREDMERDGVDVALLGGQRQRYQYFGYEVSGMEISFLLTATNLRHVLKGESSEISLLPVDADDDQLLDQLYGYYQKRPITGRTREEFYEVMQTWKNKLYAVLDETTCIGYMCTSEDGRMVAEYELEDPERVLQVMKAHMDQHEVRDVMIGLGMYETAKIQALEPYCERMEIRQNDQMMILNYNKVLQALFDLKAGCCSLQDGSMVLGIREKGNYRIQVEAGKASITETEAPADWTLSSMEAVGYLTTAKGYRIPEDVKAPAGWFPLYFNMSQCDCF